MSTVLKAKRVSIPGLSIRAFQNCIRNHLIVLTRRLLLSQALETILHDAALFETEVQPRTLPPNQVADDKVCEVHGVGNLHHDFDDSAYQMNSNRLLQ